MSDDDLPRPRRPRGRLGGLASDAIRPAVFPRQGKQGGHIPSSRAAAAARHSDRGDSCKRPAPEGLERPSTHAKEMEAKALSFAEAFPGSCRAYEAGAPLRHGQHLAKLAWQAAVTQEAVDNLVMQQKTLHADCGGFRIRKTRDVVCFHLGFKMVVQVPSLVFSCGEEWTVHPFEVGYAPTTATDCCETWVGLYEVLAFKDMCYGNGLSASGERPTHDHNLPAAAAWLFPACLSSPPLSPLTQPS